MTTTLINQRIDQALAWKGCTRDEAAAMLGLDGAWRLYLEENWPKVADLLDVRVRWLVDGPDDEYRVWCQLVLGQRKGSRRGLVNQASDRLAATCVPRLQAPIWTGVICGSRRRRRRAYRRPYALQWSRGTTRQLVISGGTEAVAEVRSFSLWLGRNLLAEVYQTPHGWDYVTMLHGELTRFGSCLPYAWLARLLATTRVRAQLDRLVGRCGDA